MRKCPDLAGAIVVVMEAGAAGEIGGQWPRMVSSRSLVSSSVSGDTRMVKCLPPREFELVVETT